jgi:hypothetical protein
MILSTDSELATNGCWSLGTTGELRTFRGFAHSRSLTRRINPGSSGDSHISNGPARTFYAHMHPGRSHLLRERTVQSP